MIDSLPRRYYHDLLNDELHGFCIINNVTQRLKIADFVLFYYTERSGNAAEILYSAVCNLYIGVCQRKSEYMCNFVRLIQREI